MFMIIISFICVISGIATLTAYATESLPYNITNNFGEDASRELLVLWHNSASITTQYIEYTDALDTDFENATQVAVEGELWSTSGSVGSYSERRIFKVAINDLEPDSHYIYRVGTTAAWSKIFKHRTAEIDGTFSFTGVTDAQTASHEMMIITMNAANEFDDDNRFFLNTGDMVDYMGSQPNQIADYALKANQINDERVIATVLGNHETYGINNAEVRDESTIYNGFFYNPQNGLDGEGNLSRKNTSYYFYYNNVLFVMINTVISNHAAQAEWIRDVLEADKNSDRPAQYIVVGAHYGPFGNYFYLNSNMDDIKKYYAPIYTEYDVDIALFGHDHTYFRTHPLKIGYGGQLDSFDAVEGGVYYMSMGTTGPKFGGGQEASREQFAVCTMDALSSGVFVNIKVTREKLTVSAKSVVGNEVNDVFEIPAKRTWSSTEFGEPEIKTSPKLNGAYVDFGIDRVRSISKIEVLKRDGTQVSGVLTAETEGFLLENLRPQSTYYYILRLTFLDDSKLDTPFNFSTLSIVSVENTTIIIDSMLEEATKYILYLNDKKIVELETSTTLYEFKDLLAFSVYLVKIEMYSDEKYLGYDLAFIRTLQIE